MSSAKFKKKGNLILVLTQEESCFSEWTWENNPKPGPRQSVHLWIAEPCFSRVQTTEGWTAEHTTQMVQWPANISNADFWRWTADPLTQPGILIPQSPGAGGSWWIGDGFLLQIQAAGAPAQVQDRRQDHQLLRFCAKEVQEVLQRKVRSYFHAYLSFDSSSQDVIIALFQCDKHVIPKGCIISHLTQHTPFTLNGWKGDFVKILIVSFSHWRYICDSFDIVCLYFLLELGRFFVFDSVFVFVFWSGGVTSHDHSLIPLFLHTSCQHTAIIIAITTIGIVNMTIMITIIILIIFNLYWRKVFLPL